MLQRILFFLLPIFLCTSLTKAQDFWEILPTPDTANPRTITIHNNGDIWSGSNGVYLSKDNGETWEYKGLFGNTVFSIATDSLDNVFAGASGVLHKSTDYGESWDCVISGLDNILSIECINNGLMFAGSGFDVGIIRSVDYGETWDTVFMVPGWEEYVFDIEAGLNNEVYAATTAYLGHGGGVYCAFDEGETWEHIGLLYSYVKALSINSSGKLFAAVYGHHNTGIGGCYVYDEMASEWTLLTQDLNAKGIVINSIGNIYLGVSNEVGGPGGVYCSQDAGQTWSWNNSGLSVNSIERIFISHADYVFPLTYDSHVLHRSINPTVSIHEPTIKSIDFKTFPNPFVDHLYIKINTQNEIFNGKLIIFDICGKIIEEIKINQIANNSQISINSSNWQPGIYLYQISLNKQTYTGKIIKSK